MNLKEITSKNKRMEWAGNSIIFCLFDILSLTTIGKTDTPAITDLAAIFDWFLGHVIFFFVLYYGVEKLLMKNESSIQG